jgi:CubicO group peptidase (beta-lactamase class C family)
MEIHGRIGPDYEPVRKAFEANFEEHGDLGASFCLVRDGEVVVDVWAGHKDEARTEPWEEDTIVNVYSSTKTLTALCALFLADHGELDFAAPAARYWPEFAAAGKAEVPVATFMAHTAGLSGLDEPTKPEDLYDWEKITSLLAAQAPWWEPGTASGYHAITQGYLIGEIVRRITGLSLGRFFREEIAEPLGVDFHIGLPEEHEPRVGLLVPPAESPAQEELPPDSIPARTFASPFAPAEYSRTRAWRAAEIPAAGGTGNARSIARAQALLAGGGEAFGRRLMSEAGARRALEEQIDGTDLVLRVPLRHGLGFGLGNSMVPLPSTNMCFWGGWGGSLVIVDFDNRLSFSYVMNRMQSGLMGDQRGMTLAAAVYESLSGG